MLNPRTTERLTGGDDRVEFVRVEPVLGGQRGLGACVEREVAGAVEDEETKGESEWVESLEAEPSRVMSLGCVMIEGGLSG